MKFDFTFDSQKGPRPYQEDRLFIAYLLDGYLLAVMDGHGGDMAVSIVRENLERTWLAFEGEKPVERIKKTFNQLHTLTKDILSGSTLSLAWLPDNEERVYVAVLGDSPVLVKSYDGTVYVSAEHNVRSNPAEAQAVKDRGGWVSGGYAGVKLDGPGLQMSRALGDSELDRILNREPEITDYPLGKRSFVMLGTDGCFDPGHSDKSEVDDVIAMLENNAKAGDIVDRAIYERVFDNVTAIVARVTEV